MAAHADPAFHSVLEGHNDMVVPVAEIVLGYLLAHPFVTIPIIGPRTLQQLAESLNAVELKLKLEDIRFLEKNGDESPTIF